ncbi:MAG TPA: hypothetical protein VEI06_10820 [Gemmatimonadaceae bacterium]|nr:hypothetical protein [Gemmatimonadaceae bacterium]
MEDQSKQALKGLDLLLERVAPWLLEVGGWVFGGLVAVNLVIAASLITVGPVDRAVMISIACFAGALPLNVAGIFLVRLVRDMNEIGLDELTLRSFKEADFPHIESYFPPARERAALSKRRGRVALGYSLGIAAVSAGLTVAGLVAALWHMAWWVAVAFAATTVLSVGLILIMLGHSLPPESETDKALQKRHRRSRQRLGATLE